MWTKSSSNHCKPDFGFSISLSFKFLSFILIYLVIFITPAAFQFYTKNSITLGLSVKMGVAVNSYMAKTTR